MRQTLTVLGITLLLFGLLTDPLSSEEVASGTLVFDVKNYSSDVKLKEKVQKQLEHGGLEWGMVDNVLVIPLVNKKYVKPEMPYTTRYGEARTLTLKPGEYKVTCIGYIHSSNSGDVDKVLSASAFFNESVLAFKVLPGKTTTLEIHPTMQKQSKTSFLVKVKMFMPDLKVKVIEDGVQAVEKVINERTDSSVAWDDYSGPLKF